MSRAIWFLIPSSVLEESYSPAAVVAWKSKGWVGTFISELLIAVGSLSLYSVFILVTCYWSTMMRKVNIEILEPHGVVRPKPRGLGAIKMFLIIMSSVGAIQLLHILLFLCGIVNSEGMILLDSVTLSVIAVVISVFMTILSTRIRVVLMTIGAINSNSTRPQINRILAMTRVGNAFFFIRVAVELAFTASCFFQMKGAMLCSDVLYRTVESLSTCSINESINFHLSLTLLSYAGNHSFAVVIKDKYWDWYIAIKHVSEIVVLISQLLISTAIKTYDLSQPTSLNLPTPRGFRRYCYRADYLTAPTPSCFIFSHCTYTHVFFAFSHCTYIHVYCVFLPDVPVTLQATKPR